VLRDFRLERSTRSVLPWRGSMLRRPFSSSAGTHYLAMAISSRPLESASGTFRLSRAVDVDPRYGLRRILLHEGPLVPNKSIDGRKLVRKGQKLWDGLAVAGLNAARKNVPRLVVLMISDRLDDNSLLSVDQAVGYLRSIHVPLLIWAPDTDAAAAFGLADQDRLFFGQTGLADLEEEVGHLLGQQTIIWIKGDHLPTELSINPKAPADVGFAR
jgi:hypothetical protein